MILFYNKETFKEPNFIKRVLQWKEEGNILGIHTNYTYLQIKDILVSFPYDYLITCNGAAIFDNNGKLLEEYLINSSICKKIQSDLQLFSTVINFQIFKAKQDHIETSKNIIKLNVVLSNSIELAEITRFICNKYRNYIKVYLTGNKSFEVVAKQSNLNNNLTYICSNHNIDEDYIYVVGKTNVESITNENFLNTHKIENQDNKKTIKYQTKKFLENVPN